MMENTTLEGVENSSLVYASFVQRLVAYIVDGLIVGIAQVIIGFILGAILPASLASVVSGVIGLIIGIGYFAYLESSEKQATIGKQLMKLKVTDIDGGRISMGTAILRYLAKILSALILMVGFLMVLFTEKKQGLHDILAKTLVYKHQ